MAKPRRGPPKANIEALQKGHALFEKAPLVSWLQTGAYFDWTGTHDFAPDAWLQIERGTYRVSKLPVVTVHLNPWRRADPEEWAHVLAQAILHLVLDHVDPRERDAAWRTACEARAVEFLRHLDIGRRPAELGSIEVASPGNDARETADYLRRNPHDTRFADLGLAGRGRPTWVFAPGTLDITDDERKAHAQTFAAAVRRALSKAVESASKRPAGGRVGHYPNSYAQQARSWFVANYPLLASLAASFEIVEDEAICDRLDIAVAAVHSELREIYIRPRYPMTPEQMRFVVAHELLHVGLRHEERRQGRDPFLWNVACDYAINDWLMEAGVGTLPGDGGLFDVGLRGMSAEAIYDRITTDLRVMRKLRKLKTFRGFGASDLLSDRSPTWWRAGPGCDLDAFYRRALAEGLELHLKTPGRGLLPGAMVEEIRSLQQPPIPWDVKLAQWLDGFIQPLERRRSFARASRRQASTPDIAHPAWLRPQEQALARTFAVLIDSSGSMSRMALGKGVGAVASYAISREVARVRMVLCDACPHDRGWVDPEDLLGRVEITGRGGTILQPGIDLIRDAPDFPKDGPLLIVTDGACDSLALTREHAYLMPEGTRLPFPTRAPVFRFE